MAASIALQVVVSPLLGVVFDNLSSLIRKKVGGRWGVDKEMKKVSSTLSTIQAVLADAEERQVTNKAILNWLGKLKEAAYAADDILDEWATEALELEMEAEEKTHINQVFGSFLSSFSVEKIKLSYGIAKRINELTARFDEIADESTKFHFREGAVETKLYPYRNRETSSLLTEPVIYGRDKEIEELVGLLLKNENGHEHLFVCPILGLGGLGKTTFAQGLYNDERVANHFELRIWVCVSDDFDVKRLTRAILESFFGGASGAEALDPLQRCLQEKLSGKRFLLVLDDVWNENQEDWHKFKASLSSGARGSSVIVTTRLNTVASITRTCPPYKLSLLSKDDCWSLFKQCTFGPGNKEKPNLVKIGMEIVEKCGGVPLAAKALRSALRFKDEEREWLFVRDSEIWDLPVDEGSILPALILSYTHLSPYLRQCFTYCSIFPKDYRINKEEITRLWIANGLVQFRDNMDLEDVANDIFNSLLWRSLFQDIKKDWAGYITVMMHDLVHDLACSISLNECYHVGKNSQITKVPHGTRHLSINEPKTPLWEINQSAPDLRTLIVVWGFSEIQIDSIFSRLAFLRALSLSLRSDHTTLPNSIGNLKHLRYLKMSEAHGLTPLPGSIYELRNLRTLIVRSCSRLQTLPKLMSSLRHLDVDDCKVLTEMPIGIDELTCLQTLNFFIVSSDSGRGIKELKGLNHLRGRFEIRGLEHVTSLEDAKEANLMRKQSLQRLSLIWSKSHLEDRDVAEGLQPHPNIKELLIDKYQGLKIPSWLDHCSSSLPNLVKLKLTCCSRCKYLPSSLGKLPLLKSLVIRGMNCVRFFFNEEDILVNGFPSLVNLTLGDMTELEDWCPCPSTPVNSEQGKLLFLPSLENLTIEGCPKLKRLPLSPLSCLEHLLVWECHEMILATFTNLPRLFYLLVCDFKETTYFPVGVFENLPALQYLFIRGCEKLKTLPTELTKLPSLKHLEIAGCGELATLSLVDEIPEFSSTLEHLALDYLPSLASLPSWMGRLTNLRTLDIWRSHPALDQHLKKEK